MSTSDTDEARREAITYLRTHARKLMAAQSIDELTATIRDVDRRLFHRERIIAKPTT